MRQRVPECVYMLIYGTVGPLFLLCSSDVAIASLIADFGDGMGLSRWKGSIAGTFTLFRLHSSMR